MNLAKAQRLDGGDYLLRKVKRGEVDVVGWLTTVADCLEPNDRGGWRFCCLNPDHPDQHPSMDLNPLENGSWAWGCWSCGAGGYGILSLAQLALGSTRDALLSLTGHLATTPASVPLTTRTEPQSVPQIATRPLTARALRYLDGRDIPAWFAERQGLRSYSGTNPRYLNSIIIPHQNGWWFCRTTVAGRKPAYLYPRGFPRSTTLYGWEEAYRSPVVVVVEGAVDCWKVQLAGLPCVAVLGNQVSRDQLAMLRSFRRLLILPDPDAGGQVLADAFSTTQGAKIVRLRKGSDPGDYPTHRLRQLLR